MGNQRAKRIAIMAYIDLNPCAGYIYQYATVMSLPHTKLHHFPNVSGSSITKHPEQFPGNYKEGNPW